MGVEVLPRVPWEPGTLVWELVTNRGPWIVLSDEGERDVKVRSYRWALYEGWKVSSESVNRATLTDKRPPGRLWRFAVWCWRLLF